MVAEEDVLVRGHVVAVVAERPGRHLDGLVVGEDAAADPPGVEAVAEDEGAEDQGRDQSRHAGHFSPGAWVGETLSWRLDRWPGITPDIT